MSAIDIIHGPHSTTTKQHTFYDHLTYEGAHNLDAMTDREEHRARRRVWDLALSSKNMDLYELNARNSTQIWLDKISAAVKTQEPLDVSLYARLVAFDNMTRTGFSVDLEAVKRGVENRLIHLMGVPFARVAASAHSVWPLTLLRKLRLLNEVGQFDLATHEMCFTREVCISENLHLCICRQLTNAEQVRRPEGHHEVLPR